MSVFCIAGFVLSGCSDKNSNAIKGEEVAVLTFAPNVPPPITRDYATKMIVNLEVIEKEMEE